MSIHEHIEIMLNSPKGEKRVSGNYSFIIPSINFNDAVMIFSDLSTSLKRYIKSN